MKILFDTNVLAAGLLSDHYQFALCDPWLNRAVEGKLDLFVSTHTLAELYAILTILPGLRVSPATARELVETQVVPLATLVTLTPADYLAVLGRMADLNLSSGIVYDGVIAYAVEKAGVDRLLTFDVEHFRRVWPEGAKRIVSP